MTDDELEARQQELADELGCGTYPAQEYVRELCELVIEWTHRKRQIIKMKPEWEAREKSARETILSLGEASEQIEAGNTEAAIHCAFTAASIFTAAGLSDLVKIGTKSKKSGQAGHEATHGTEEEKNNRWNAYKIELKQKLDDDKNRYKSLTDLRRELAKSHAVSLKTIERHTKDVEDTRKQKK